MRGNCAHKPGWLIGSKEVGETMPALPWLVCVPGSQRSISCTSSPRRCKAQAQATPTMPAPITATRMSLLAKAGPLQ
jgi:hypothetical protein